eukprot:scaffold229278_cov31-Prasinocladus_malaysianus.AAC.4
MVSSGRTDWSQSDSPRVVPSRPTHATERLALPSSTQGLLHSSQGPAVQIPGLHGTVLHGRSRWRDEKGIPPHSSGGSPGIPPQLTDLVDMPPPHSAVQGSQAPSCQADWPEPQVSTAQVCERLAGSDRHAERGRRSPRLPLQATVRSDRPPSHTASHSPQGDTASTASSSEQLLTLQARCVGGASPAPASIQSLGSAKAQPSSANCAHCTSRVCEPPPQGLVHSVKGLRVTLSRLNVGGLLPELGDADGKGSLDGYGSWPGRQGGLAQVWDWLRAGHSAAPPDGMATMNLSRHWRPGPQALSHVPQAPHSVTLHSDEHAWVLHGCTSVVTEHGKPEPVGGTTTSRDRVCVPLPHGAEQTDHGPQEPSLQSESLKHRSSGTKQDCCWVRAGHALPPLVGISRTYRLRVWKPDPHWAEQGLQSLQGLTMQSDSHSGPPTPWQVCSWISSGQGLPPPDGCCRTVLSRVITPVPQGLLQSLQPPQDDTLQSAFEASRSSLTVYVLVVLVSAATTSIFSSAWAASRLTSVPRGPLASMNTNTSPSAATLTAGLELVVVTCTQTLPTSAASETEYSNCELEKDGAKGSSGPAESTACRDVDLVDLLGIAVWGFYGDRNLGVALRELKGLKAIGLDGDT